MKIGFTIESQSAEIYVSVISLDSFNAFDEMWKGTDEHQGGVTIKNPEATRSSWQYFVPREISLAAVPVLNAFVANPTGGNVCT